MKNTKKLRGIFAPVLTPYKDNYEIDYDDLRRMVDYTVDCGCHGLVTSVNVAEFYAMTDEERIKTTREIIRQTDGRIPVVAGVSGWSPEHSIYHAKIAEDLGADAVMATGPSIPPVDWNGISEFYHRLNDAIHIPIILQSAPQLGPAITPEQVIQLCRECENIQMLKEETSHQMDIISALTKMSKDLEPGIFSGVMSGASGVTIIDTYRRGACGCMPANHIPDVFVTIWELMENGQFNEAYEIFEDIAPFLLFDRNFPMPTFYHVLYKRGIFKSDRFRTGAPNMDERTKQEMAHVIKKVEQYYRV